ADTHSLHSWASLLHNAASHASRVGNTLDARIMLMKAMKVWEKLLGQDHRETLRSREMLGLVLHDERRWKEAEELQRLVLDTRKKVDRPEHALALGSMANLASTYRNQGQWDEAEKLEEQVMETRKTKLGPDHLDTL
ncbi:hypothetical protein GE09DRAFT_1256422, partial [Coniochaeta sp. 2T2.1]